jgi:hypothetical protein
MTTPEIGAAILKKQGIEASKADAQTIALTLQHSLKNHEGKGVEIVGEARSAMAIERGCQLRQPYLLLLLGMKLGFLCLHPRYQFLDPVKGGPIGDQGRHTLVMLDLAVEFDAFATHRNPAQFVKRSNPHRVA